MARRRRPAILLTVIGLVLVALLLGFPASGQPEQCPKGWTLTFNPSSSDRNSNTYMCGKDVNGKGNDGQGSNLKEDR